VTNAWRARDRGAARPLCSRPGRAAAPQPQGRSGGGVHRGTPRGRRSPPSRRQLGSGIPTNLSKSRGQANGFPRFRVGKWDSVRKAPAGRRVEEVKMVWRRPATSRGRDGRGGTAAERRGFPSLFIIRVFGLRSFSPVFNYENLFGSFFIFFLDGPFGSFFTCFFPFFYP
jgi:hypothetical protein